MKRILVVVAGLSAGAIVAVLLAASGALLGSLPDLDGAVRLEGLDAPVTLERDALGVVTVRARDRAAVAFGTGFAHAQDRYFQMDLLRRDAAGELAALVGQAAVARDAGRRLHRLRHVARAVVEREEPRERALLDAYRRGVNAGLDTLAVRPFEYLLLGAPPVRWRDEDTVLVVFAMYLQLNDETARRDATLDALRASLTGEMFAFLAQPGTAWDAPLSGEPHRPLAAPGPGACDLRGSPAAAGLAARTTGARAESASGVATTVLDTSDAGEGVLGSNAWVVSGRHTATGAGLVANDMHLRLQIPNVWYRMRMVVEGSAGEPAKDVIGASLPGAPAMVVGSNRRVAWGFTNSTGDWSDRVHVVPDPADPGRYRSARGSVAFDEHVETVEVRDAPSHVVRVRQTLWGPIVGVGAGGAQVALRWLAHRPEATNLRIVRIEDAASAAEAAAIARTVGIPPQNFMAADAAGSIAWTIAGRIPRRVDVDPLLPADAPAAPGWDGWLAPEEYPGIDEHPSGRLWTANARAVDGEWLRAIGDGGYAVGARATQIRDALLGLESATEPDMLSIQLDDRALFLERWRRLLLNAIPGDGAPADPDLAEVARVVAAWDGRAVPYASGYRLVRTFREAVHEAVLGGIARGCGGLGAGFRFERMPQLEGPVWTLVNERPPHLLAREHASWDGLLLTAARTALERCGAGGPGGCPWSAVSAPSLAHPLSRALPVLAPLLDMAPRALPGGTWVPRVHKGSSGASERFAVSPGHEASGYFHMPGGQSGHPLSRFYRAGHEAWADGERLAFLPGPTRHSLVLEPVRDR